MKKSGSLEARNVIYKASLALTKSQTEDARSFLRKEILLSQKARELSPVFHFSLGDPFTALSVSPTTTHIQGCSV